jgi:hypothetical protein
MKLPWRRHRPTTRGQALVEFALVLPVLLLVVLLALDFGRVFFGWIGLQNAARQGANFAALNPTAWGSPGDAGVRADYLLQVQHDTSVLNCAPESPLPTPDFLDGTAIGGRVEVSLTCDFTPLTPLVANLFSGGVVKIGANAIFPVRGGELAGVPVGTALPSAGASAAPTSCVVPSFSGIRKNSAQTLWTQAKFLTQVQFLAGSGNYVIGQQTIQGGESVPCTSLITVGPL